jgi:hypothetical protein
VPSSPLATESASLRACFKAAVFGGRGGGQTEIADAHYGEPVIHGDQRFGAGISVGDASCGIQKQRRVLHTTQHPRELPGSIGVPAELQRRIERVANAAEDGRTLEGSRRFVRPRAPKGRSQSRRPPLSLPGV